MDAPRARAARSRAERVFAGVTRRPLFTLVASLVPFVVAAAFVPGLQKDTRSKSYQHPKHEASLATQRLEELFGVSNDLSILIVIEHPGPGGVFNPNSLELVRWLTERAEKIPGVDPDRVTSLATEKNIIGTDEGMRVEPFFDLAPIDAATASQMREAVLDFELYVDTLVSRDTHATAIIVELLEPKYGSSVYEEIMGLAARAPVQEEAIHVCGLGAYDALVGEYIDADAERLNPIAGLAIIAILLLAFRTLRGVLVPIAAVGAAIALAFGTMAAAGVPFYSVTTSMSVILIAIGVCDAIHILSHYYAELAAERCSSREAIVRAMGEMWRPVLITSVTTIAGFMALSAGTNMPPLRWYGVFASVGVAGALVASVLWIPAFLALLKPRRSVVCPGGGPGSPVVDPFGRLTARLGRFVYRRSGLVLVLAGCIVAVAVLGALRVERNNDYKGSFHPSEPLYQAELAINRSLGGINSLDIIVESDAPEGLYEPEALRTIEAFQHHLETLPHVRSTDSLVDYIKQMHRAMNGDDPAYYAIPDDPNLIAQYFLIYSANADPADFEDVVDYDFQRAYLRTSFDRGFWSDARAAVPRVQEYIQREFDDGDLRATLAGQINLYYFLDRETARSQAVGVSLAFLSVLLVTALCFRSLVAGLLTVTPVVLAVLMVYATMGYWRIWLDFATAMSGAIAIGISVDFSVHTIDRLIELVRVRRKTLEEAFEEIYPATGRALFFNFAAVLFSFGVLATSHVPPLRSFGVLVGVCVSASFLGSMTLVPALVKVLRPRFLGLPRAETVDGPEMSPRGLIRAMRDDALRKPGGET